MANDLEAFLKHYKKFFEGHDCELLSFDQGPIQSAVPGFQVLRVTPGPKLGLWVYASIGASTIEHEDTGLIEFVLVSPHETSRCVELLAMAAYYHYSHNLGLGDTLPLGESWQDDSICNHWLVSKPYPFGPDLEICNLGGTHAHVAWLLPITESERVFKVEHGLEALEQKFDDAELCYWEIERAAVV